MVENWVTFNQWFVALGFKIRQTSNLWIKGLDDRDIDWKVRLLSIAWTMSKYVKLNIFDFDQTHVCLATCTYGE